MWLHAKGGFVSVVADHADTSYVFVRARSAKHLDAVAGGLYSVVTTPNRDYPYRVRMSRTEWATRLSHLAQSIDYTNFKDAAGAEHGHDSWYANALHDIWDVLFRYARSERPA